MLIQARDGFVRARTQLINQARGLAKPWEHGCPRVRPWHSPSVSATRRHWICFLGLSRCSKRSST
jgi:hypothetical protein